MRIFGISHAVLPSTWQRLCLFIRSLWTSTCPTWLPTLAFVRMLYVFFFLKFVFYCFHLGKDHDYDDPELPRFADPLDDQESSNQEDSFDCVWCCHSSILFPRGVFPPPRGAWPSWIHSVIQTVFCYMIMMLAPSKIQPYCVFGFTLSYMSIWYVLRILRDVLA